MPTRCTTRKFCLHLPRPGRNDWHVRFTAPAIDGTRRIFRNTGAKEISPAKRVAAKIIESFWADAGRGADRLRLCPSDFESDPCLATEYVPAFRAFKTNVRKARPKWKPPKTRSMSNSTKRRSI